MKFIVFLEATERGLAIQSKKETYFFIKHRLIN